jgi:hypothetical protein
VRSASQLQSRFPKAESCLVVPRPPGHPVLFICYTLLHDPSETGMLTRRRELGAPWNFFWSTFPGGLLGLVLHPPPRLLEDVQKLAD